MAVRDFPDPVDSKNSRSELEPPILPSQTDSSCSGQAARLTGALVAFLMLAAQDPGSVNLRISDDGEMILSSPLAAELARRLGPPGDPPPAVH